MLARRGGRRWQCSMRPVLLISSTASLTRIGCSGCSSDSRCCMSSSPYTSATRPDMGTYASSAMTTETLFESVPNFSEGRRPEVIEAITGAAMKTHLLDVDADPDHNRVVVSIAARGPELLDALMDTVGVAVDRIDLLEHEGAHPRVGGADVVPIVPLGAPLASATEIARELGERAWSELTVPVYFYGYGTNRRLADIRAARTPPDLGGPDLHPRAGATCIGVRDMLVAFNVMLPGI